jgi:hypothetical protein
MWPLACLRWYGRSTGTHKWRIYASSAATTRTTAAGRLALVLWPELVGDDPRVKGAMCMRRSAPRMATGLARRNAWLVYLLLGLVATAIYALDLSPGVNDTVSSAIGLGAVLALAVGPRWHGATPLWPWILLSIAAGLFLVGVLVRPWAAAATGIAAFGADAFTVPGYLCMIVALVELILARGGLERHALIDGLIVGSARRWPRSCCSPSGRVDHRPRDLDLGGGRRVPALRRRAAAAFDQPGLHHRRAAAQLPAADEHDGTAALR